MRTGIFLLLGIFLLIISGSFLKTSIAQDETDAGLSPQQVFAKLSGMQDDVIDKMKKREASMVKIISSLPKGDYKTIKAESDKINIEYSIESGMDADVVADYNSMIASDFIFLDQDLNQYSSALSEAADEKYLEGALVQFDLVLRSCVDCHYAFAKGKFPSLADSMIE